MDIKDRVATFCHFFKVFTVLAGCLIFNYTSSSLLFRLLGLSSLSIVIVCLLCFSTVLLLWYRLERSFKARQTYEQQNLLQELRSLDPEKIPFIIDCFLELDRIRSREMGAVYPLEKQCVVCLDAEARIQTFPCEHVVVCGWCAWQSLKLSYLQRSNHRCVICRSDIEDFSGCLIKDLIHINWKDAKRIMEDVKTNY